MQRSQVRLNKEEKKLNKSSWTTIQWGFININFRMVVYKEAKIHSVHWEEEVKIGDYFQIPSPERKKRQGGSQRIQRLRAWFFKWERLDRIL